MKGHTWILFFQRRRSAIGIGLFVLFVALMIAGWIFCANAFFAGYWFGLMFWVQLSVGCLILLLVQLLTGGAWGTASAPLLRRGASALFVLLPLFIPAFFALPHIFSWTTIAAGVSSQELVRKLPWLNGPGFITRTIVFLAILTALIVRWRRPGWTVKSPGAGWSGPSLAAVIAVLSFASADWMMSVEPSFYSSLYPFMYFSGAMMSTLAFVCGTLAWLEIRKIVPPQTEILYALGQLFLSAVLFWGYIVFSQYIIIWTGNLPDEAAWYVVRGHHGWQWLTLFVIVFHFVVPFCLLLSREWKRDPHRLLKISLTVFLVHFAEVYWLVGPRRGGSYHFNIFEIVMPLVIGAWWIWFVAGRGETSLEISPTSGEDR